MLYSDLNSIMQGHIPSHVIVLQEILHIVKIL